MASVSIGRSRFPPEEIRWFATSGIIVTSDPVRDRMVAFTRSISAATRAVSRSIEGGEWLSNGTTTAKDQAPVARTRDNRNAMVDGQERNPSNQRRVAIRENQ